MSLVCICTTESRPRVLHGPNGSRYGDELLDLVGTCHDGAYRGQGQLLGPSNPRLESLMGFKRRGYLCTWSTWHPREVEKGSCASGRFRRHLDGFRRFMVHLNHNEVWGQTPTLVHNLSHVISSRSRMHHHGSCGCGSRTTSGQLKIVNAPHSALTIRTRTKHVL